MKIDGARADWPGGTINPTGRRYVPSIAQRLIMRVRWLKCLFLCQYCVG